MVSEGVSADERAEPQEQMMQELVRLGCEVLQCNIWKRTLMPKPSGSLQKETLGWRKKAGVCPGLNLPGAASFGTFHRCC